MNPKLSGSLEHQILKLASEGLTPEQICEAFPDTVIEPEAVAIIIQTATSTKKLSLDECITTLGVEMVNILADIARDPEKNEAARVKAAAILVGHKSQLPETGAEELSRMFARQRELREKNDKKILKLEQPSKAA
jgi:hypothetical protein